MRRPLAELMIDAIDTSLRTLLPPEKRHTTRPNPAEKIAESELNQDEKKHVAGLMRVNHAGEVCAQALYQGQALTAKLENTREQMQAAAAEEIDHLSWCEDRLTELGYSPSILNPFWYIGSFALGALAGIAGDKYSLGFLEETEKQVTAHLQSHLDKLPHQDHKSQAILAQMKIDEEQHADMAYQAGATSLPAPIQHLMKYVSKLLTKSSYYL